ncbi:UDP-3-O-acyl N-acetylglucosamine deacetylase [uncultured Alphaproteobacteria bacterium]|uniref:UDP-3-O-acyl-N-acetylglucosamine deacetylase n=1 Tax=uncultured Alphaproteobacteria bacterium TaxID=91750 RepID=A0A212JKH6_9PROT|nr:UDP-3-O-acyl N-acetylglucosamine deacetylase [uncultured Alphaproteobacteria bacterium]
MTILVESPRTMFDVTHAHEAPVAERTAGRVVAFKQKTLKSAIGCSGVGLHTGKKISMTLKPAPIGTGIVFNRTDAGEKDGRIPARYDTVVDTRLCTCVGNADGFVVGTIEHLMSALAGMGIDNLIVDIDGPEVPVMDGSSAPFVFLIECAGIAEQDAPRRAIKVLKPVSVADGGILARLDPADDGFTVDFEIDFANPLIGRQTFGMTFPLTEASAESGYRAEVSSARTFGFLEDVERLNKMGLALGGSLENAVVISGNKVLNEEGLRYEDECVRHKALDALGDLYLAGAPLVGRFSGLKSGHAHSNLLLRALFADADAWTFVEIDDMAAAQPREWRHTA